MRSGTAQCAPPTPHQLTRNPFVRNFLPSYGQPNVDAIDNLGPDGGSQGGQIVFEGTPRQLLAATGSHTADFLRRDVDASPALRTFNQPWKDDGMNQPLGLAR